MGTRDDYDLAWKDALVKYLPDFLRFFFPRIYHEIDWSKTPRFLDKELQSVAPGGRRVVDTLVELHLLAGGPPLLVLVHVEVQAQKESGFEERVFRYNARLSDHYYPKPVCSLVILADNHRTWRPTIYRHNFWGSRIQFRFGVVKLLDFDEEKKLARLERSKNPFALLVAATLHTQQTRPVSDLRTDKKLAMLKALYRSGWGREKIVEFFNVVDRMMKLSPVQQRRFYAELDEFEKEMKMPYINSVERMGRKDGRKEGLEQSLKVFLQARFGVLPTDLVKRLETLSLKKMEGLLPWCSIRQVRPHPWRPCIPSRSVEALSNTTRYSAFASPRERGA